MTPEFAYNRLPEDVTINYPEFTKFIQLYYLWGQQHGYDSIINNNRSLLYQQVYNKEYEERVIKNLGIDISIIKDSPIKTEMLYKLVNEFPQFAKIYTEILELGFIVAQKRIYGFQGFDAKEKVQWVIKNQPQLLVRVSNKMAASYLGISPSTLSRIKSKL